MNEMIKFSSNNSLFGGSNKIDIRTINQLDASDYNVMGIILSHNALMRSLDANTDFGVLFKEFEKAINSIKDQINIKDQIINFNVQHIISQTRSILDYFAHGHYDIATSLAKEVAHDITIMSNIIIDNSLLGKKRYNNFMSDLVRNESRLFFKNMNTHSDHVLTYNECWDQIDDEDCAVIKNSRSCCSMNIFCNEYCGPLYIHNEDFGVGGIIMCEYEQQLYCAMAHRFGTITEDDYTGAVKFVPDNSYNSDLISNITTAVELNNLNCVIKTVFDFVVYNDECDDAVAENDDEYYD